MAEAINGYGGNSSLWQNVGGVKFHSGQTPLIFDPVSTVAFGYASCTGVSTTYIAALRVAGVPARLVGTPAWLGDPAKGNHNWVEVWVDGEWAFVDQDGNKELNTGWFYPGDTGFQQPGTTNHSIFSSSWAPPPSS